MTTLTESWPNWNRTTQDTSVTVFTTPTDMPKTDHTTVMNGNRESDPSTTHVTSLSTHVRSVSDYNTETPQPRIRTTAIDDVTTQEAPSPSSKEPTRGRLLRDITRSRHVQIRTVSVKYKRNLTCWWLIHY